MMNFREFIICTVITTLIIVFIISCLLYFSLYMLFDAPKWVFKAICSFNFLYFGLGVIRHNYKKYKIKTTTNKE